MNSLLEELNCETVFTIPVFGGIGVSEAVVVTWIIMAVLVVLCLCLVRNLKVENPGKKQPPYLKKTIPLPLPDARRQRP